MGDTVYRLFMGDKIALTITGNYRSKIIPAIGIV